jgi:hypothetical protein
MATDNTLQQANLQRFRTFTEQQVAAAKPVVAELWQTCNVEPLRALIAENISDLSDDVLLDVENRFAFGSEQSFFAQRHAYLSKLSTERFKLVCELANLGDDLEAARDREDLWDVAEAYGVGRETVRAASDLLSQETVVDDGLEEFLFQCSRERGLRAQREADRWLELDGVKHLVLARAPVLWSGWECDGTAWVVEKDGKPMLVTSNHGGQQLGNVELLKSKLQEYEDAIKATKLLLGLVGAD